MQAGTASVLTRVMMGHLHNCLKAFPGQTKTKMLMVDLSALANQVFTSWIPACLGDDPVIPQAGELAKMAQFFGHFEENSNGLMIFLDPNSCRLPWLLLLHVTRLTGLAGKGGSCAGLLCGSLAARVRPGHSSVSGRSGCHVSQFLSVPAKKSQCYVKKTWIM